MLQLAQGRYAAAVWVQRSLILHVDGKLNIKHVYLGCKVYVDLYSAFLRKAPQMRSDVDHTVLPANYTTRAFTPQPQSISAILAGTHFTVPRRAEGWVDLGGWLHTEIKFRLRESNPDTFTHPSTNRAQRRLTSLI